ncbi:LysR family transcriptional regulator [Burkholderia sp. S171]|uniref:LysR family transcriptional regulator n=1 Tax=Burkholderia sp. S171 TaxID=1641860 RepID=UPI00131CD2FC|nr:LysR family transcriptional regulator [Burkholderia sp. S171]
MTDLLPATDTEMLDPDLLATFCLVAETKNFSRAALRMGIAQPVVTRKVKRLEEVLGTPLFTRTNRGCELTQSGELLASRAMGILHQLEQLKQEVRHSGQVVAGTITLGMTHVAGTLLAPHLLPAVAAQWPNLRVSLVEGVSHVLSRLARDRELSLAILYDPPVDADLILTPLLMDRLYLVGAPGPAWQELKRPGVRSIATLPLVLPSAGQTVRVLLQDAFSEIGAPLVPAYEANSITLLKAMVAQGLGYTVLTLGAVADEVASGKLMAVPLAQQGMSIALTLASTREHSRLRTVQLMSELIATEIRRLAKSGAWPGSPHVMRG